MPERSLRPASTLRTTPATPPRWLYTRAQPIAIRNVLDYASAVRLALANLDTGHVETAWSDALASSQADTTPVMFTTQEGIVGERRRLAVEAPAESVYRAFTRLGGATGWLCMDRAWRVEQNS